MIFEFLVTPVLLHMMVASDVSVSTTTYTRFDDNDVYTGTVLETVVVRSVTYCASVCSRADRCQVINACPRDGSFQQLVCSLLADGTLQAEDSLKNDTPQDCFQMRKIARSDASRCQNGGTFVSGRCKCLMEFAGEVCERRIRDCSEAYDNGHRLGMPGRPLLIQPVGTDEPFWIVCVLEWGGLGYPLLRSRMVSMNASWAAAKTWIGDDLSVTTISFDYFIGLDNLRRLLTQASYQGSVYCMYDSFRSRGWIYYGNVYVKSENASYALSYQYTWTPDESLENGFQGTGPIVFSTGDHDVYSCGNIYPGWYGADCSGYSLFADNVVWPANGSDRNINNLNFGVTRVSNFSVN